MYRYIETEKNENTAIIWLSRPEKRNAFHEQMIDELLMALGSFKHEKNLRILIIRGRGIVFSAGADIDWMQSVMNYSFNENKLESKQLYRLFYAIYSFPVPVITIVHGASFGGANGIVAASDISIADDETVFRFSEVQLGLIPATISPFVVNRIGEFNARELMLTGKQFDADRALKTGLINFSGKEKEINDYLHSTVNSIQAAAAGSVKNTKWLISKIADRIHMGEMEDITADMIASARLSDEGQEGMKAFAEKRNPDWSKISNTQN
ncbi:MAG: enoyl-CoA hydratase/isomerase family protein [Bacteroidales bacterium]|nr:enoyl-CoA hydratase/isomerase family protein [Bacteroidales bacterium]